MKALFGISILVALVTAHTLGHSQTTNVLPKRPIAETCGNDYLPMDQVIKPKFSYYSVGYSKPGKPTSATFDVVGVDQMMPVIDEYCRVHLTALACQKVMDESMASDRANK